MERNINEEFDGRVTPPQPVRQNAKACWAPPRTSRKPREDASPVDLAMPEAGRGVRNLFQDFEAAAPKPPQTLVPPALAFHIMQDCPGTPNRKCDEISSAASVVTLTKPQFAEVASPGRISTMSAATADSVANSSQSFEAGMVSRIVMQPTPVGNGDEVMVPAELRTRVTSISTAATSSPRAHALHRASNHQLLRMAHPLRSGTSFLGVHSSLQESSSGDFTVAAFPVVLQPEDAPTLATTSEQPSYVTPQKRKRDSPLHITPETALPSVIDDMMKRAGTADAVLQNSAALQALRRVLPQRLGNLYSLFEGLDHTLLLHRRRGGGGTGIQPTFEALKTEVEAYARHTFELTHLLQMAALAPSAYTLTAVLVNDTNKSITQSALPSSAIAAAMSHASKRAAGTWRVAISANNALSQELEKLLKPEQSATTGADGGVDAAAATEAKLADKSTSPAVSATLESSVIARRHAFLAHILAHVHVAHVDVLRRENPAATVDDSIAFVRDNGGWHAKFDADKVLLPQLALQDVSPVFAIAASAPTTQLSSTSTSTTSTNTAPSGDKSAAAAAHRPLSAADVREKRRMMMQRGAAPSSDATITQPTTTIPPTTVDAELVGLPAHLIQRANEKQESYKALLERQRPRTAAEPSTESTAHVLSGLRTSRISNPTTATQFAECVLDQYFHAHKSAMLAADLIPKIRFAMQLAASDGEIKACVQDLSALCPEWMTVEELTAGLNVRLNRSIGLVALKDLVKRKLEQKIGVDAGVVAT